MSFTSNILEDFGVVKESIYITGCSKIVNPFVVPFIIAWTYFLSVKGEHANRNEMETRNTRTMNISHELIILFFFVKKKIVQIKYFNKHIKWGNINITYFSSQFDCKNISNRND